MRAKECESGAESAPLAADISFTGISSLQKDGIVTLAGTAYRLEGALVGVEPGFDKPQPSFSPLQPNTASAASLNQTKAKYRLIDRTHLHRIGFIFSLLI